MNKLSQANHANFSFAVTGKDKNYSVVSFTGQERLSELFEFHIMLLLLDPLELDALSTGDGATLQWLDTEGNAIRCVHGLVKSVELQQPGDRSVTCRVTLTPWLFPFAIRRNCRVFQNKNISEIIAAILEGGGITGESYELRLQGEYKAIETLVQYSESDHDFICRLMADAGIFYRFEHAEEKSILVFYDDMSAVSVGQDISLVYLRPGMYEQTNAESVRQVRRISNLVNQKIVLGDYDYLNPDQLTLQTAGNAGVLQLEQYGYPAGTGSGSIGNGKAQKRLQRDLLKETIFYCSSEDLRLQPGAQVNIREHPFQEFNRLLFITHLEHEAHQPQVLEQDAGIKAGYYLNHFQAVPPASSWVPAQTPAKPLISGVQTATVIGPESGQIHTDSQGRIKVRFHWDHQRPRQEASSAWLRVAQAWAGPGWGSYFIPRVGQEVVVVFENGDPDRPLVSASVYNQKNKPPVDASIHAWRSSFRSCSANASAGGNEICLDDSADAERLHFYGNRDITARAENDNIWYVGRNRHVLVKQDHFSSIEGDRHVLVAGDQSQEVNGNLSLKCGVDMQLNSVGSFGLESNDYMHMKSENELVLESAVTVTLKCGKSFIRLDESGISLSGVLLRLNSGGVAGIGRGVLTDRVTIADELQEDGSVQQAQDQVSHDSESSPAARVLQQSARDGTPFCEQCDDC